MSRNSEKAKASLNRWRTMGNAGGEAASAPPQKRNRLLASDCDNLTECENKRNDLETTIAKKVEEIQTRRIATEVDREAVRALNDEINKLMRVKHQWEMQIRRLGGQQRGGSGKEDYMYFGAARELDEVKYYLNEQKQLGLVRMLEAEEEQQQQQQGSQSKLRLTPAYYGFVENEQELERLERQVDFEQQPAAPQQPVEIERETIHWDESWPTPTHEDVERSLLEFKKKQLLRKFQLA